MTERAELDPEPIRREVVELVEEPSQCIQRRGHINGKDIVMSLGLLHQQLEDCDELSRDGISKIDGRADEQLHILDREKFGSALTTLD